RSWHLSAGHGARRLILALAALASGRATAAAQAPRDTARCSGRGTVVTDVAPHTGRLPFGVGEHLEYRVKFGILPVGTAEMQLVAHDTVRGQPVVRALLTISGGVRGLSVHDTTTSWFDTTTFAPRR